jgi:TPP-dependent 2-oxoacid decarboxylase
VYIVPLSVISGLLTRLLQVYIGSITRPDVKKKVESAKLILSIGSLKSDYNTGNFSYNIPTQRTIEVLVILHHHLPHTDMPSTYSFTLIGHNSNIRRSLRLG